MKNTGKRPLLCIICAWSKKVIKSSLRLLSKIFFLLLPTILVIQLITSGSLQIPSGFRVKRTAQHPLIHPIIPNTRWEHLKPCGIMFNEQKEFDAARQCVNDNVWPLNPISSELLPPRCFIVSVESPDVFGIPAFNFIPLVDITGTGAIVGVYQPETHTVFVVENVDAAMVYRHELQHYFLHVHDPSSGGRGHFQSIWKRCEPGFYTPSEKTKLIGTLMNDELIEKSSSLPEQK